MAVRAAANACISMIRTAAADAAAVPCRIPRTGSRPGKRIEILRRFREPVAAVFPHVSDHVVKPKGIRFFHSYGVRETKRVVVKPRNAGKHGFCDICSVQKLTEITT